MGDENVEDNGTTSTTACGDSLHVYPEVGASAMLETARLSLSLEGDENFRVGFTDVNWQETSKTNQVGHCRERIARRRPAVRNLRPIVVEARPAIATVAVRATRAATANVDNF